MRVLLINRFEIKKKKEERKKEREKMSFVSFGCTHIV